MLTRAKITSSPRFVPVLTIQKLHFVTFGSKVNPIMADDISLEEKWRKFDVALDKLQRTVEAGRVVPDEIFNEFLMAAENYRSDMRYMARLGSTTNDSDRIL